MARWAWRPSATGWPPPLWSHPWLVQRLFPQRATLFPNRLIPLAILLWAYLYAQWLLYVLAVYYFFRSARIVVWRLFGDADPRNAYDPTVTRVQKLRAWTAPTMSIILLAAFASPEVFMKEKIAQPFYLLIVAPWLYVATALIVIPAVIRWTPRERRPAMRPTLRSLLPAFGCYVGTLLVAYAFLIGLMLATPDKVDLDTASLPVKAAVGVAVWLTLVFLFASVRVVRTGFGVAALHPALPAVLSGFLVWECYAVNGFPDVPVAVGWLLLLGGPVMMSAIVWWEIHRLRVRHGVTLRGGWTADAARPPLPAGAGP